MHEVQKIEDRTQEKRIDLEAMKAAKKAAEDSKGLAAAIRKAIGVGRIRGRIEAWDIKSEHKEEYA